MELTGNTGNMNNTEDKNLGKRSKSLEPATNSDGNGKKRTSSYKKSNVNNVRSNKSDAKTDTKIDTNIDTNIDTKTEPKTKPKTNSRPKSGQTRQRRKKSTNGTNDTEIAAESEEYIELVNHTNNINVDNVESSESNETTNPNMIMDLLNDYDRDAEKQKDAQEPILNEELFRLAIKPIDQKYEVIWKIYKKQHEAHWTAEEIDFSNDRHDFDQLDKNIQHFIKRILAFFAGADTIVNINIRKKFSKITVKEAEVAYGFQQMMENIHGEVYADMLINIIQNPDEQYELINAFKNVGSIKKMIDWANKWIESDRRIAFSLVVFCIFEGLMFSGAFAAIYWLKKVLGDDRMKGLTQSNNLIAKDEGMHTNFGCVMYDYILHRLTQQEIHSLMLEAVNICKEFTIDAIRVDMIGMNSKLMHQYIEYVADRLTVYLGYEKLFNTKIPDQFQFMDTIGFLNKDNFFERRATEYQKAYNDKNRANWTFKILNDY